MATITVSGPDASGNLILSNRGNATTTPNSNVLWNVTGSSIASITITPSPKTGQSNIWSSAPTNFPNTTSKNWRGTVGGTNNVSEDYNIGFTLNNGNTGSHDPTISVNR